MAESLLRLLKEPAESSIGVDLHHAIGMENQPVPRTDPARSASSRRTNGQRLANVVATVVESLLLPGARTATTKMVIPAITHA